MDCRIQRRQAWPIARWFKKGGTYGSDEWSCQLVEGFVGAAGRWAEIDDGAGVDRRALHPSGAFVAMHEGANCATARVLDAHDDVLGHWAL